MHVEWEEDYERGYEWWLMKEAKLRNPKIKLYGLPWAFPGWLGNGTQSPYIDNYKLADYIFKWIRGAEVYHGLFIDFIGIWNERWCDTGYVKVLRQTLDQNGYENVRIVASDLDFGIVDFVKADTALASVVDYIGAHYPGVLSPDDAKELGIPLWSSEDFSTYNDETGGGCWARILNQNYVQGLMTSTIAWNLIDSFFQGLPWDRTSLMTAREPWSGNYIVESPIWMSAHTTQLTEIGWSYLPHGHGVGMLKSGGSYVTLVSPDLKDFTIVVETMSHDHSVCIRPPLPHYTVETQVVTFTLAGSFASVKSLNVWQSQLKFGANETSTYFQSLGSVPVVDGAVSLTVGVDEIYSLTTLSTGYHGKHPDPPESAPFPLPFVEDFEKYPLSAEPYILAPQQGSFDVVDVGGDHGKVMRQMVLQPPIAWCQDTLRLNSSLNLFGRFNWTDVEVDVDMNAGEINGTNAVYLGVRIDNAGCGTDTALGIFLFITPKDNSFKLTNDIKGQKILLEGKNQSAIQSGWNKVSLTVQGQTAVASVNGVKLFNTQIPSTPANGFVGVGTDIYGYADFDNIYVHNTTTRSHKHHIQSQPLYFVKEEIH
ncbi:galactocerebrosidase-like isoform X2 [Physella acuta]|nr:galactocerebrosidase-like isoform X2 [Physella acuta]XP_059159372.1 galactocerebrosidase-like isoform X2 [Physella acuta]